MTPIEKSPYKNIYESVMEKVTKKTVYFDRVYTQPLGWVRFIEENKCCNKYYLNISNRELNDDGKVCFDFNLDQEDDPELEEAELLYCICNYEDHYKVFEMERSGGNGIRIEKIVDGFPEFFVHGHGSCECKRLLIVDLVGEEIKNLASKEPKCQ